MNYSNPFPGIRPFGVADTKFFFGREEQIKELNHKLMKVNFVAVVGDSGSGKSSLVRAGLIPHLHSDWRVAIFRPESSPVHNLANAMNADSALGSFTDKSYTEINLNYSSRGILETMKYSTYQGKVLLIVDQFEELFRFKNENREEALRFISLVITAVTEENSKISVLIIMRSEFLGNCTEFKGLPELINEGQFLIPRLTRQQYKETIIGPLANQGIKISPSLVSRLLNDIGNDPDQLPVLQHSLMLTFNEWLKDDVSKPIDITHYDASGGMDDGLNKHCDRIFAELKAKGYEQSAIRIFQRLTDINEEGIKIRRPTKLSELIYINQNNQNHVNEIINAFREEDCNFLIPSFEKELTNETIVDISHECLMRKWSRLHYWILEEKENKRILLRLVNQYQSSKKKEIGLLNNVALSYYLGWLKYKEFRDERGLKFHDETLNWSSRYTEEFAQSVKFLERSKTQNVLKRVSFFLVLLAFGFSTAYLFSYKRDLENKNLKKLNIEIAEKQQALKRDSFHTALFFAKNDEAHKSKLLFDDSIIKLGTKYTAVVSASNSHKEQITKLGVKKIELEILLKQKDEEIKTEINEKEYLKRSIESERKKIFKSIISLRDSLNKEKLLKDSLLFEVLVENPLIVSEIKSKFETLMRSKKISQNNRGYIKKYLDVIENIRGTDFGSFSAEIKMNFLLKYLVKNPKEISERIMREGFRGVIKANSFSDFSYKGDKSFYVNSSNQDLKNKLRKLLIEVFGYREKQRSEIGSNRMLTVENLNITTIIIDL